VFSFDEFKWGGMHLKKVELGNRFTICLKTEEREEDLGGYGGFEELLDTY
jgi:hypothetical protein